MIPIPKDMVLPLPQISNAVDYLMLQRKIEASSIFFESLINAIVYELYFPEEVKAADAEVLKYLTNLPELKDGWSDETKMKTIDKLYKELSDTKHPFSIAMGKMKTVPEVRIIEGLDCSVQRKPPLPLEGQAEQ